jgi:nucleoside-diphosphate-sugar epimerase
MKFNRSCASSLREIVFGRKNMIDEMHVIFGSGPLAQATLQALLKRGRTVRMINRSGKRPAGVPAGVEMAAGDASDASFTRQVCRDAAVVYQCASPAYQNWAKKFPALQAAILEGAAANGAKLIVGENLYMYGAPNGQPLCEDMPYRAHTRKGRLRAELSEALFAAHRAGKVRTAAARGSDFYGPGVTGSVLGGRTIAPLLKGKPAEVTGSLDQPHSYTYIRDFGEAMAILGERDEALGQPWHVPNRPALTQRDLLTLFFKEAGLQPKFSVMGKGMLTLGGLFVPAAREMVEMLYEFEQPFVVDASKFVQAFGDISTPYEVAVKETLGWYRDQFANA